MPRKAADKSHLYMLPSIQQMQFITRVLRSPEEGKKLRSLVDRWFDSGPDLQKMLIEDPELHRQLNNGRCHVVPTGTGGRLLALPAGAGQGPLSGDQAALTLFTTLVTHPLASRLGNRCEKCGQYYLKNSMRQKLYCSSRCARSRSALSSARKQRTAKHTEELGRARNAMAKLTTLSRKRDWKALVASRTRLSKKWITRAVNKGELIDPTRLGR